MEVCLFGGGTAQGGKEDRNLLGGKGAGLAEMARLGLPVPPGFTITTEVCRQYRAEGRLPEHIRKKLPELMQHIEKIAGGRFGDPSSPLLVSVRSGARVSMPGMMDTVLDLGINDKVVVGLAKAANERFAWDCYRRFVAMFGDVVLGMGDGPFDRILEEHKNGKTDGDLTAEDFRAICREELKIADVPQEPLAQLEAAIEAVFRSWDNPRAIAYRELNDIPDDWGTAVTVQAMVFGNLGDDSGTGVVFTRDPAGGENKLYGEFLPGAQGEDVVAGIRTPLHIDEMQKRFPQAFAELLAVRTKLEKHYRDMQDIELTVQRGKLWVLQCRSGKRTGAAAVRIAVEMVDEGLLKRDDALKRIEPAQLDQTLRPVFVRDGKRMVLGTGLPAGPGAASGKATFTALEAEQRAARGERVVLIRAQTSPEDIRGMNAAEALLTAWGGMTSHAALVARQMGKVAVVGCGQMRVDEGARLARFDGHVVRDGDWISLDGTAGEVLEGKIETQPSQALRGLLGTGGLDSLEYRHVARVLAWADEVRRLGVRANADQPDQAAVAVALGAQGIGLCRTEHMFFGEGKIGPMREMIVADTLEERKAALAKLLPLQRADFAALFKVMNGRPVTVRTLDPPLHEFLPHDSTDIDKLARSIGKPVAEIRRRIDALAETNPMLGMRGCRLGIAYPEITAMQAQAIFEAACDVAESGVPVRPQVMIPLVGSLAELEHQAKVVHATASRVFAESVRHIEYHVGTMIEIPRAALRAGEIAATAEFFSFGTNDLTQTTYGLSRDDVGAVLTKYIDEGIYPRDPFVTLDRDGVGELIRIALKRGKEARPHLEAGICGEHGGDPASIAFCHELGLDYVSCSPSRLPVARLAAARAALLSEASS